MLSALALLLSARTPDPTSGRHLVFDQNFQKQRAIDEKVWLFDDGPVYNHEIEKYTKSGAHNAYLTKDGLVIEARKAASKVTSARLETRSAWKYGYFEAEARMPQGRGTWPAFWMLNQRLRAGSVGWPKCGEIDVMENVGFDPAKFHFSLHCDKYNFMKHNQRTFVQDVPDYKAFHRYGVDWQPSRITFYLDRKAVYTVEKKEDSVDAWPWTEPFYIILNLAIGGDWGGAMGIDDKIFPSLYVVRYVRIYE